MIDDRKMALTTEEALDFLRTVRAQEKAREIIALRRSGKSALTIAKRLGLTHHRVSTILSECAYGHLRHRPIYVLHHLVRVTWALYKSREVPK